jgi:phage host-nuclease inhibitor protein Gam
MKKVRNNGFIIIAVVAILAFMPLAVNILTSSTRTMLTETTTATMEAQNRNILKSAAAWARFNADKLTENKKGHTILLDTAGLGAKDATCSTTIIGADDRGIEVEMTVLYSQGRRRFKRMVKHTIH